MKSLEHILSSYPWFDHVEGMKFVETHRDAFRTSGHWLFLPKAISSFHKVTNAAELWYIHEGKLIIHLLTSDGKHRQLLLGARSARGRTSRGRNSCRLLAGSRITGRCAVRIRNKCLRTGIFVRMFCFGRPEFLDSRISAIF
jgi:hypothetical protein